MSCKVWDIADIMEGLAPAHLAEDWDNVGLQAGSLQADIEADLVSLDADSEDIAEAREKGAGLLVCHHPPIFRPLRRLDTDEPAGALLRDALVAEVTIFAAHTNLDASPLGVNAVLADLFELEDHRPLLAAPAGESYKLVTFLPAEHVPAVSAALFEAGAGIIGDYIGCSFRVEGTGTFTPGPGSHPAYGDAAGANEVGEVRLEMVVSDVELEEAVRALLASHPYEEPAYDIYCRNNPSGAGMGRVGELPVAISLGELARRCRTLLNNPTVRLAGDPANAVHRVAVCGGSGGDMAGAALAAGAQVLITGDVKYHAARDALASGLAVIDAGHYYSERPVVPHLATLLAERARGAGLEVGILVSEKHTCPWKDGGGD